MILSFSIVLIIGLVNSVQSIREPTFLQQYMSNQLQGSISLFIQTGDEIDESDKDSEEMIDAVVETIPDDLDATGFIQIDDISAEEGNLDESDKDSELVIEEVIETNPEEEADGEGIEFVQYDASEVFIQDMN